MKRPRFCSAGPYVLMVLVAIQVLVAADPHRKTLNAINDVEVPPFAYAHAALGFDSPDARNVTVSKDGSTGRYNVVVRLRETSPRLKSCALSIFEGAFLADFDYVQFMSLEHGLGGASWKSKPAGLIFWEMGLGQRKSVDLNVQKVTIEVCSVEDSVLWNEEIGLGPVRRAVKKTQVPGMNKIDRAFYWLLQRALQTEDHDHDLERLVGLERLVALGPIAVSVALTVKSSDEHYALSLLKYPVVASEPKSFRVTERWGLDRKDVRALIGNQDKWSSDAVWAKVQIEKCEEPKRESATDGNVDEDLGPSDGQ